MSPRPTWTFITNHGAVLAHIGQSRQITAREIAGRLGITERAVRRIIKDLTVEGYIRAEREGRVNRYEVYDDLPLRRDDQRGVVVGQLLEVLRQEPVTSTDRRS